MRIRVKNGQVVCNSVSWQKFGSFFVVMADFKTKYAEVLAYSNAYGWEESAEIYISKGYRSLHLDETAEEECCTISIGGMHLIHFPEISRYTMTVVLAPFDYNIFDEVWNLGWEIKND